MRCVLRVSDVRLGGVVHRDGAQISFEHPIGASLQVVDLIGFSPEQLRQLADLANSLAQQMAGSRRRVFRKVLKRCWSEGERAWKPEIVEAVLRRHAPEAELSEETVVEMMQEYEQGQDTFAGTAY